MQLDLKLSNKIFTKKENTQIIETKALTGHSTHKTSFNIWHSLKKTKDQVGPKT